MSHSADPPGIVKAKKKIQRRVDNVRRARLTRNCNPSTRGSADVYHHAERGKSIKQ